MNVTDGSRAVSGATVSIGDENSITGSAGGCTLKNIKDGLQVITVVATGFEDYSEEIIVNEENSSFDIVITRIDDSP